MRTGQCQHRPPGRPSLSTLPGPYSRHGEIPRLEETEGSRTPDGTIQPFLAGAAFLAIRAQVPLIPIALTGVYDLFFIHTHHFYPREIVISVGEPISTTNLTVRQTDELNTRLRENIDHLREEASGALRSDLGSMPSQVSPS